MSKKTSNFYQKLLEQLVLLTSILAATGCGAGFDSPDWVKTLRVLAVQKDHPYAAPTTDPSNPSQVNLTMLSDDGALKWTDTPRPIQRLWFSGCDDLPGDQYFTCLARMYGLWQLYAKTHPGNNPGQVLAEGQTWSPVDDWSTLSADEQTQSAVALVSLVGAKIPADLAVSYVSTYRIGAGSYFTYPIPPLIIENHQPSSDPRIPKYGLSFIFFTACAGQIDVAPNWQNVNIGQTLIDATLGFPFVCKDDTGALLGPDDFVSGYTQLFVYGKGTANNNPVIDGVRFKGNIVGADAGVDADASANGYVGGEVGADAAAISDADADVDASAISDAGANGYVGANLDAGANMGANTSAYCINGDCVPLVAPTRAASDPCKDLPLSLHVPACSGNCPTYAFQPSIDTSDPRNNDIDTFASIDRSPVGEQMWIDYYTDRGSLNHAVRNLHDANLGWFDDYAVSWTPPSDAGPVNLWAVVHDNRGGTAWVRLVVCVGA